MSPRLNASWRRRYAARVLRPLTKRSALRAGLRPRTSPPDAVGDRQAARPASMPVMPLADPSPGGCRYAPIVIVSRTFSPQNAVGGEKGRLALGGRSLRSRVRVFPPPVPRRGRRGVKGARRVSLGSKTAPGGRDDSVPRQQPAITRPLPLPCRCRNLRSECGMQYTTPVHFSALAARPDRDDAAPTRQAIGRRLGHPNRGGGCAVGPDEHMSAHPYIHMFRHNVPTPREQRSLEMGLQACLASMPLGG